MRFFLCLCARRWRPSPSASFTSSPLAFSPTDPPHTRGDTSSAATKGPPPTALAGVDDGGDYTYISSDAALRPAPLPLPALTALVTFKFRIPASGEADNRPKLRRRRGAAEGSARRGLRRSAPIPRRLGLRHLRAHHLRRGKRRSYGSKSPGDGDREAIAGTRTEQ